jgi:hypothetical protein
MIRTDLVLIDNILPSSFSPFRTIEYEHHLRTFDARLLSLEGWHPFVGRTTFEHELAALPMAPDLKSRVHRFADRQDIAGRMAYMTFLRVAELSFPWLEERQLPFVLQLYPGSSFHLDQPGSDAVLRRLVDSPLMRRVITTQELTRSYLTDRIGLQPGRIAHIYGGVFESRLGFDFERDKRRYPRDKPTLDVCFVAHRYGDNISAKGYDLFVAVARGLVEAGHERVRFHVVGGYRPEDVVLDSLGSLFTFHGPRPSEFFDAFYPGMDLIVSLNRPFDLKPGVFDGFPTGSCIEAGLHGVLNCIADPLGLNDGLVDGRDIILLTLDVGSSIGTVGALLADPPRLYDLARANWRRYHEVFDTDRQLQARSNVIREVLDDVRPRGRSWWKRLSVRQRPS